MKQKYEDIIQKSEAAAAKQNKIANMVGGMKLLLVAVMLFTFYKAYVTGLFSKWTMGLCMELVVYIIACKKHSTLFEEISFQKGRAQISRQNLKRMQGGWTEFPDTGEEFADGSHGYATDLDIVGNNSVFQFLNSTNTYHGRTRLAKDLLYPDYSKEEIFQRQQGITELSKEYEWTMGTEYFFSKIGVDSGFPKLLKELQDQTVFLKSGLGKGLFGLSRLVTMAALLFGLISSNPMGVYFLEVMLLFQMILWLAGFGKIRNYLGHMKKIPYKMSAYNDVIKEIRTKEFESDKLKEMKEKLLVAEEGIRELTRISSNINQCNNEIACFVLNVLFLWDYKNALDFQKWKQHYGQKVEEWFELLGELESLISFTNLARNCENVCVPSITEAGKEIVMKSVGHPLLPNQKRVCNDFKMDGEIVIISGSNMSGKSTFMRTIGVNIVLANAGSYVCAKKMECALLSVVTSMRIVDRTTEGVSTFYSELIRIKAILDAAQKNPNMLFLIDEIFRGTNSVDRIKGAEGVLKRLHTLGATGIITTHDLEICKLESKHDAIVNYSFYEEYKEDEMYFDYKIKAGISKTRNAEFLLKKVGIL